jgi:hypothetical protein
MKTFIFIFVLLVTTYSSNAATCISLASGNWNNPATWSCGAVPSPGDTIIIAVGHTVSISANTNMNGAASTLIIDGILLFNAPGAKLRLGCGSVVYLNATGSIQSAGIGIPSHSLRICESDVWSGPVGSIFGPLIFGTPLPIELTYFTAEPEGTVVRFSWETASELNNDYFTIEGSLDGLNWNFVEKITGAGTTQEVKRYVSTMNNTRFRYGYFRLKQTDFDGQMSYSDVVSVQLSELDRIQISPNPSNGSKIHLVLPSDEQSELHIINSEGVIVYSIVSYAGAEIGLEDVNFRAGFYLVQVVQNGVYYRDRLVIE